MLVRPCFLVVDREFAGSVSSRKLVLETAKFNVITAYSCREAAATLKLFPNVSAIVMNAQTSDPDCAPFLDDLRAGYPAVKLALVGHDFPSGVEPDLAVESFAPEKLLKGLRKLFPQDSAALEQKETELEEK